MLHYCYILYSVQLNKYYVGETSDFSNRIEMHNIGFSTFTSKAKDWKLHLLIPCPDKSVALKIESHIKSMKSRKYIENLGRYPDIVMNLLNRFKIA
jgi:putative endonuclease